ncbi:MAG TPA: thiamine pyrophosphate-dependent enzyme, partial [Candidatus Deferrimicrobium sp.]|nr:thiamine pyrophosphate-dependent enzyme [Candidatus Deferrimicrobium sp.]
AQWQRMFYGERYSHTSLQGNTDFVKLAEAMGVTGLRAKEPAELRPALQQLLEAKGPVLLDVWIPASEDVLPMVPAGKKLNQMIMGG